MASNQDLLVREMGHLQVSSYSPQQYSPTSKKVAPVVPPKPKSDMYATVVPKSNGMYHSPVHPSSQHSTVSQSTSLGKDVVSSIYLVTFLSLKRIFMHFKHLY